MSHLDPALSLGQSPLDPDLPGRVGAVILAGGTAARMDGVDKAGIELDGLTLLERSLAATMTAFEVVVVGHQVPATRPVTWAMEDPRGGGPAAGLLTALGRFLRPPELVQVLAVDMPHVTPGTFARLGEVLDDAAVDGAVLVDPEGRRQPLCAVYRRRSLAGAAPPGPHDWHGLAMRDLLRPLRLREVRADAVEASDVDTWDDLRAMREQRQAWRDLDGEPR